MTGLLLFIAAGFVIGWAVAHPAAWAVVLIPVAFVLAAGDDVDFLVAILGIVLTALAVLVGRIVARRRPSEEPLESDESNEREARDRSDGPDERDEPNEPNDRNDRNDRND